MKKLALLLGICLATLCGCSDEESGQMQAGQTAKSDTGQRSAMSSYETMNTFTSLEDLEAKYDWNDGEAEIKYIDVVDGQGREVNKGDWIVAFYTLWDGNGNMLQSNMSDIPFVTEVGVGKLIKGWDMLVPGMKDGGVRRLVVPGNMAYGENPPPGIEPNATLVFELKIVASGTKGE